MIPSPQLFHRNPETISNRYQRVTATDRISLWTSTCNSPRDRDDKFVSCIHTIIHLQSVCPGNVARVNMHGARDTIQCLATADHMKTPTRALVFRNVFDTRCEDIERPNWDMQVK